MAEAKSYLEMSDEEMMNLDPSTLDLKDEVVVEDTEEQAQPAEEVADVKAEDEAEDKEDAAAPEVAAESKDEDDSDDEVTETKEEKPTEPPKEEVKKDEEVDAIDYKAEYERLMTPFKANGRDIAVKNIDDAVALMQMGANYNKKMAALKPNLKLMKMLENNGLLSEDKINFLIDVEKKNPSAINKLVKDSGLDVMDLDTDKAGDYTPKTYTVDDREMELDTVLDSIQDTPSYTRTLDIVSTKWDGASKQVIAATPQILRVINDHVQSGIYDTIVAEMERERVFGRLAGLSDIDAYRKTGDAIQARGGFNSLGKQEKTSPVAPVVVQPKAKVVDDSLKDKKRAAGSTKPAVSSPVSKDFNPLSLSDEEFAKLANGKYY